MLAPLLTARLGSVRLLVGGLVAAAIVMFVALAGPSLAQAAIRFDRRLALVGARELQRHTLHVGERPTDNVDQCGACMMSYEATGSRPAALFADMTKSDRLRLAALGLALVACAVVVAAASATGAESAPQVCVDRWNWTHEFEPEGGPPVSVTAHPCVIWLQYRSDTSRSNYFECKIDRFGVFACAEHATRPAPKLLRKVHRAPIGAINRNTGIITLRGARQSTVRPKPAWVRRWRWVAGFIFPFDTPRRLLPGIVAHHEPWTGGLKRGCGRPYPHHLFSTCANGLYVLYPRWPLRKGDLLAFSYTQYRGSRTYVIQRYAP